MKPVGTVRGELDAVRIRRAEMRESLGGLEQALAAPAPRQESLWGAGVHAALTALAAGFTAHIEVTEGPGGLHEAILGGDLRLANAVAALTAQHAQISQRLDALVDDSAAPVGTADVEQLRERATDLLAALARHRQRGADLIYEAFATDIGGGD